MIRSLLTTAMSAIAASRAKHMAKQTAYGALAVFAIMLAGLFATLAVFFALSAQIGAAPAAATVAAVLAIVAVATFAWAKSRQDADNSENIVERLGLPELIGVKDVEAANKYLNKGYAQLRKADPVKLSAGAFVIAFLVTRMRR